MSSQQHIASGKPTDVAGGGVHSAERAELRKRRETGVHTPPLDPVKEGSRESGSSRNSFSSESLRLSGSLLSRDPVRRGRSRSLEAESDLESISVISEKSSLDSSASHGTSPRFELPDTLRLSLNSVSTMGGASLTRRASSGKFLSLNTLDREGAKRKQDEMLRLLDATNRLSAEKDELIGTIAEQAHTIQSLKDDKYLSLLSSVNSTDSNGKMRDLEEAVTLMQFKHREQERELASTIQRKDAERESLMRVASELHNRVVELEAFCQRTVLENEQLSEQLKQKSSLAGYGPTIDKILDRRVKAASFVFWGTKAGVHKHARDAFEETLELKSKLKSLGKFFRRWAKACTTPLKTFREFELKLPLYQRRMKRLRTAFRAWGKTSKTFRMEEEFVAEREERLFKVAFSAFSRALRNSRNVKAFTAARAGRSVRAAFGAIQRSADRVKTAARSARRLMSIRDNGNAGKILLKWAVQAKKQRGLKNRSMAFLRTKINPPFLKRMFAHMKKCTAILKVERKEGKKETVLRGKKLFVDIFKRFMLLKFVANIKMLQRMAMFIEARQIAILRAWRDVTMIGLSTCEGGGRNEEVAAESIWNGVSDILVPEKVLGSGSTVEIARWLRREVSDRYAVFFDARPMITEFTNEPTETIISWHSKEVSAHLSSYRGDEAGFTFSPQESEFISNHMLKNRDTSNFVISRRFLYAVAAMVEAKIILARTKNHYPRSDDSDDEVQAGKGAEGGEQGQGDWQVQAPVEAGQAGDGDANYSEWSLGSPSGGGESLDAGTAVRQGGWARGLLQSVQGVIGDAKTLDFTVPSGVKSLMGALGGGFGAPTPTRLPATPVSAMVTAMMTPPAAATPATPPIRGPVPKYDPRVSGISPAAAISAAAPPRAAAPAAAAAARGPPTPAPAARRPSTLAPAAAVTHPVAAPPAAPPPALPAAPAAPAPAAAPPAAPPPALPAAPAAPAPAAAPPAAHTAALPAAHTAAPPAAHTAAPAAPAPAAATVISMGGQRDAAFYQRALANETLWEYI
jgi:hypothetical protein